MFSMFSIQNDMLDNYQPSAGGNVLLEGQVVKPFAPILGSLRLSGISRGRLPLLVVSTFYCISKGR